MAEKKNEVKKFNFEESIKELETLANSLEKGELPLDDMLENFAKGIKIAQECTKTLDAAEKKISILTKKPDGSTQKENFETE